MDCCGCVGGVAVHVEGYLWADCVPDRGDVAHVGIQAEPRFQFHGGKAVCRVALRFAHELAGVLGSGPAFAAEEAGGVGPNLRAHVAALSTEQTGNRLTQRLATQVPQGGIYGAQGADGQRLAQSGPSGAGIGPVQVNAQHVRRRAGEGSQTCVGVAAVAPARVAVVRDQLHQQVVALAQWSSACSQGIGQLHLHAVGAHRVHNHGSAFLGASPPAALTPALSLWERESGFSPARE